MTIIIFYQSPYTHSEHVQHCGNGGTAKNHRPTAAHHGGSFILHLRSPSQIIIIYHLLSSFIIFYHYPRGYRPLLENGK